MNTNELERLSIRNFKGMREFDSEMGHRTTICGANATGKTTVMDAFVWLLFGKDSQDRPDTGRGAFTIKTVDSEGRTIEKLDHEVTGIIIHNGERLTLTRRLTERWVKKARAKEATFDGNTTVYIWNGAEIGATEWQERINTIIPIKTFKMLTNPHYFSSLPWQEQLAELTRMIGDVTPDDVAEGNAEYRAVLDGIGSGNTLKDRVTTIATEHRRLKKRLDEIPSEIKGIKAATPEAPEYGELECEQNALLQEQERIDEAMRSTAEAERQHYDTIKAKQDALHAIEQKQFAVYASELEAANRQAMILNAERAKLEGEVMTASMELTNAKETLDAQRERKAQLLRFANEKIESLQKKRQELLDEWSRVDGQQFPEPTAAITCPFTKMPCDSAATQNYHQSNYENARRTFEETKVSQLDSIEAEGLKIRDQLNEATSLREKTETDCNQAIAAQQANVEQLTPKVEELKQALAATPKQTLVEKLDKKSLPEWMQLHQQAEILRTELKTLTAETTQPQDEQAKQRKHEIRQRLDAIAAELAKEGLIADNNSKVAKLEDEMASVAQQMADLEREQDIIKEIEKAVVDEVERRANSLFERVKFRTCDWQINGEPVPTCYATLDGVRYADLNSAGQVNAGLDIINTLCRQYQTTAPIFIDNAEGVNQLLHTDSQLIRLEVTNDPQLLVKTEE